MEMDGNDWVSFMHTRIVPIKSWNSIAVSYKLPPVPVMILSKADSI